MLFAIWTRPYLECQANKPSFLCQRTMKVVSKMFNFELIYFSELLVLKICNFRDKVQFIIH